MRFVPAIDVRFTSGAGVADRVSLALDDLTPAAVHEMEEGPAVVWRVFFRSAADRSAALSALARALEGADATLAAVDVPDENWAARSQASLTAVRIGRVVVAPPWDVPPAAHGDVVVVIQPSMGFGTGHHETTRLCLRLLQSLDLRERRVLDVGTGSGVLAIAAVMLGAASALGVDTDADAIACARENAARNACADRVSFRLADLRELGDTAGVVVANLTGGLIVSAAAALAARAEARSTIVISGFLRHESDAVIAAFGDRIRVVERAAEGEWEAAVLARSGEAGAPRGHEAGLKPGPTY